MVHVKVLALNCFLVLSICCVTNIECAVTEEQMMRAAKLMRDVCQPKFKVSDELVEGLKKGLYPDNKDLKSYANCVMEMMQSMKKGKLNYDASMKQIDIMLPEEYKEPFRRALNICKDVATGIKNHNEAAYTVLQCFYKNNPKFIFP